MNCSQLTELIQFNFAVIFSFAGPAGIELEVREEMKRRSQIPDQPHLKLPRVPSLKFRPKWGLFSIVFALCSAASMSAAHAGEACSLRAMAAQMLLVKTSPANKSEKFLEFLAENQFGGVLMGTDTIKPMGTMAEVLAYTRKIQSKARIGFFIAADEEGGVVQRFRKIRGELPSPAVIGQYAVDFGVDQGILAAQHLGDLTGRDLGAMGINWNFGLVMDTNPLNCAPNPGIGGLRRSYSCDPNMVAKLGSAWAEGFAKHGLLCIKHFPGHGECTADSHDEVTYLNKTWPEMQARELVPFQCAIDFNVYADPSNPSLINPVIKSVMVGHIRVRGQGNLPASLNRDLIIGKLRQEMRFSGLIVTDDLLMKGVQIKDGNDRPMAPEDIAIQAILAGNDVLIPIPGTEIKILDKICDIADNGEPQMADYLSRRVSESYERIMMVKKSEGIHPHIERTHTSEFDQQQRDLAKNLVNYEKKQMDEIRAGLGKKPARGAQELVGEKSRK